MNGFSRPRVGVIGCGRWGKNVVRNFAELGALAAVADIDDDAASGCAALYGVPALAPDALLQAPGVDAAAVAVPAEDHAALALAALAAGKHVFVEKPVALTAADARRMIDAAADKGVTLMVGHLLRFHPCFRELERIVKGGGIGRLQYLHATRAGARTFRRAENALWGFAPHDLSMILALTGAPPLSVWASETACLGKGGLDAALCRFAFPDGVSAHVFCSWLHFAKEQKLTVVGEDGMLVFDDCADWAAKLRLHRPGPDRTEGAPVAVARAEPLGLECAHFLECVETGAGPLTDGGEGLEVIEALCAARESMESGHPVQMRQAPGPGGWEAGPAFAVHEAAVAQGGRA